MIKALGSAFLAFACAALAGWLAWHHPLSGPIASVLCAAIAALAFARPLDWPLWLLTLLPVAGLMPWTGWLVVEELDLAVLAVAVGGYARWASGWPAGGGRQGAAPKPPLLLMLLLLPMLASTLISLQRGVLDAGGWEWGWWQGYREPLNSLRLAKSLFEVLLLLPLWRAACRADEALASARLAAGMVGMAVVVALLVLWERLAFTGLLNFSTDYRATALFWEMHVGGAALDAVLALTMPFALLALWRARTALGWVLAAAALALGLYACLVTFSRIVYAVLPLSLALLWWLRSRQRGGAGALPAGRLAAVLLLVGYAAAAWWVFPGSGYRGLLALLGALALLLPLARALRGLSAARWALGAALALPALLAVAGATVWLPKGAYLAYTAAWLFTAGALVAALRRPAGHGVVLAVGGFAAVLAGMVAVGQHWGDSAAMWRTLPVAGLLALLAVAAAAPCPPWPDAALTRPLWPDAALARPPWPDAALVRLSWPDAWRWQAQLLMAMAALSVLVGVFDGGAYMGERLATLKQDGELRADHGRRGLALLDGWADWAFGKGLGRYPAQQGLSGVAEDQTGDYRLVPSTGGAGAAVVLTSGKHVLGWGEIFRFSQRVALPALPVRLQLKLRGTQPVELHAEICEKHLLYEGACIVGKLLHKPATGGWQPVQMLLAGDRLSTGAWYAPKLLVFSFGLESRGSRVEIDALQLLAADGRELLHNGDFEQGLAHWYFSSDRYHLPWHLKSLTRHLLFEQGWFGLASFAGLVLAAAWRLAFGRARWHWLAPPLAAALVGLLGVGLVDSLLDIPRVSFLGFLLLAVALGLRSPRAHSGLRSGP